MKAQPLNDEAIGTMLKNASIAFIAPHGTKEAIQAKLEARMGRMADSAPGSVEAAGGSFAHAETPLRRQALPWFVKIAAGIVLACGIAFLIWWAASNGHSAVPSAYAELAEALENTKAAEWVHMQGTITGRSFESWMSLNPVRIYSKMGNGVVAAVEAETRRRYQYDPAKKTLTIEYIDSGYEHLAGKSNFVEMMLGMLEKQQKRGDVEITRAEQVQDGKTYSVLTVVPKNKKSPTMRIVIDQEAQRIVHMEHHLPKDDANASAKPVSIIEFDYPQTGPEDIYAIGVPRDARIIDKTPPKNLAALEDSVQAARKGFAPSSYVAIIHSLIKLPDRDHDSASIQIVYKKGNRYSQEFYLGAPLPILKQEKGEKRSPADEMAALEAWADTRQFSLAKFNSPMGETDLWWKDEKLQKSTSKATGVFGPPSYSIEYRLWGFKFLDSHNLKRGLIVSLPDKQGEHGRVMGVERRSPARVVKRSGYIGYPRTIRRYFNPERDYICEEEETIVDPQAAWQEDKKWMEEAPEDKLNMDYYSRRLERVLEYAKTDTGKWYAKKTLIEFENRTEEPKSQRNTSIIYLDLNREIPDELLDPDSITEEMFK